MTPATTPLLGFSGEISWLLGQISLMVSLGDGEHRTSALMNFMVVSSGMEGIATLHSGTIIPIECRMVAEALAELPSNEPVAKKRVKVAIHPEYPKQTITIGGSLYEKGKMEL
ncbi:hypothetical protein Tco_0853916 [Tanacetum coccineum]